MISFGHMKTFADQALNFLKHLDPPHRLPPGVEVMNPFKNLQAWEATTEFYQKILW